jgi:hypothetical protein
MNDQIQAKPSDPLQQDTSTAKPYTLSFLDRFMGSVKRLHIPYWLTYLLLFFLQSIIMHVLGWIDGWLPAYTFNSISLIFPLWLWGPLAIMTYLNSVSAEAVSSFRSLLDVGDETLKKLKYEFTTMPARGVILSGVFWSIIYILITYIAYDAFYMAYGTGKFFSVVLMIEGLISFFTGSAIYYHSLRQLRLVNSTMKMVRQFNLFRLNPVYAFSRVTSQVGVAWMIMLSLTLLFFPIKLASAPVLVILALQVVLALAAFVLPLRFVNRRLISEKRRLLAEITQRVESTAERLHRCLDNNEMVEVVQLNNAMNGLKAERDIVISLPTWPWRPGTLTSFLSAIVLPIIYFLIQLIIKTWLLK